MIAALLLCIVGLTIWMLNGFAGVPDSLVYWVVFPGAIILCVSAWPDGLDNYRTVSILGIVALMGLNCLPVIQALREETRQNAENGEPSFFAGLKSAIHGEFFAKEPPLKLSFEERPGPLRLWTSGVLLVTNKSERAVVPTKCVLANNGTDYSMDLPQLIKPFETVEVPLNNNKAVDKLVVGDSITLYCDDFDKPSIIRLK